MYDFEKQFKQNRTRSVVPVTCHKFENSLIDLHEKRRVYDGFLIKTAPLDKSIIIPKGEKLIDTFFVR